MGFNNMDPIDSNHRQKIEELSSIVGEQAVTTDSSERVYFSQDYFRKGSEVLAIVCPQNIDDLSQTVKAATERGLAVYPRGAGFSYTDGYLSTKPGIAIDLRSMKRILEVNETDMFVTVESGCTWAELDTALESRGLRTPFWGPLSGLHSTVGGAISQGAISLGSAKYGVSAESVLAVEVITADGGILKTGSLGQPGHSAFFRNYGPDLTGLFCGDCGALGIKAHITLRLVQRPARVFGLSFGFQSFEDLAQAMAAISPEGLASESFGMPSSFFLDAAKTSFVEDLATLWKVGKAGSGFFASAIRVAKIALSGRQFLKKAKQMGHFVVEGPNVKSVAGQAEALRGAVGSLGSELVNTVPTVMRTEPFVNHDMLSANGQRQLPPSTVLPFSSVIPFHNEFTEKVRSRSKEMAPHNMSVTPVTATFGTSAFLYEPVIAWDDCPDEFHQRHSWPQSLELAQERTANPQGRALAASIRDDMIEIAYRHGGAHLQIGKVYPYLRERNEPTVSALVSFKREVDPSNLINPGALGLS